MSDALTYLVKTRGDALGHYFAFLKQCGRHLDPKTRHLISVITKVDAQTERGLRQYLNRALREGCTPLEVLDALLMAFPTLGLAKIVWAVDIILAMKLPGFEPEAIAAAAGVAGAPAMATAPAAEPVWHDLGPVRGVAVGQTRRISAGGRNVFAHRAGLRDWRVWDSRCPHQATDIPELALTGQTLTCPQHEWRFDIRSGACTAKGDCPLTAWPCRTEQGRLLARW